MNPNDIRKLFDYTEWANDLVLTAVENLAEDQRQHDFKSSHGSIYGTLVHMAGAEWIWLERWRGRSPAALWTTADYPDLPALRLRWRQLEMERRALIYGLDEEAFERDLSYTNLRGEAFALPLIEQMQHVVNHSTYHRGQVGGMIRQLGVQPPTVDLIYFVIGRSK